MKYFYNKYYLISLILWIGSFCALANNLDPLPVTSCALNVPQEQREQALNQCKVAAQADDKEAQYQLGIYYGDDKLIEANYIESIYWLKRASSQAHVGAQLQLARMYVLGKGVPVNKIQAYVIFKIASINGSDEAMDEADSLASQMSLQELDEANYILGKFFKNYLKSVNSNHLGG